MTAMSPSSVEQLTAIEHPWLRRSPIALLPGPGTSLAHRVLDELSAALAGQGQEVQPCPNSDTAGIITTAEFGKPLPWRRALMFTARARYRLPRQPTVFTVLHAQPAELQPLLDQLAAYIEEPTPRRDLCDYPGLAPQGHEVIFEQGRRGGPMLALLRLVQAQAKCIRTILVVGEDEPERAFTFDLAGAHPETLADDARAFYRDLTMRVVTALSTSEVTNHQVMDPVVTAAEWARLDTPDAMVRAGRELGTRRFFTRMLVISELVQLPALNDAVASQYSEGCFATWDPRLHALIATVTGSARPVDKGALTHEDLAVIVGVRPDGLGAVVRQVEGRPNHSPSSESVEMRGMDEELPWLKLGPEWGLQARVPVVRSKLHGHRGISAYDPGMVEFAPLPPAFHHYPVSCATDAQARAIAHAFSHAHCLQNPDDPRQVAFTILPGHGAAVVEKWVPGKQPFETIWEYMDRGLIQVASRVPQGPFSYAQESSGLMVLPAHYTA